MIIDFVKYKHIKSASEVCFIPGAWSYHLTTQTTPAQNADVRCCLIVRIPLRPSFGMFSNKANASFNQYVIARRSARFSCLTSGEGRDIILVFICCLVISYLRLFVRYLIKQHHSFYRQQVFLARVTRTVGIKQTHKAVFYGGIEIVLHKSRTVLQFYFTHYFFNR